jgi:hypothetical protein
MHNIIRSHRITPSLRQRIRRLVFVAAAGFFGSMAMSTACLAQQLDHSAATKSVGETAPVVSTVGMLGGQDLSRAKFEEIGLQFVFVVVFGGVFTSVLSALRDDKMRKESELASLRDLIMRVDGLYRSTKQAKRMIRSRLKQNADGQEIDAVIFAARMEKLSGTQLKLEQIRNAIRTRLDLFDGERRKRILTEIEYSENYLHDVVQEFETRKVSWSDACCHISSSCEMLMDFLVESRMPGEVEVDLITMRDAYATAERFRAFQSIVGEMRKIDSGCKRHKRISDACMLLVIREMREIILERQGRLRPGRLILRPTSTPSLNGAARP